MVRTALNAGPDVQLLGGRVAALQGQAALDAYVLVTRGIQMVRRQDGIEPSPRLLEVVAVLKAASVGASSGSLTTTAARKGATSAVLRSGEVLTKEEAARVTGYSERYLRRHGEELGGWRAAGRGRPWRFDRGLLLAHIDKTGI